ncbi:tetratricopeptide repeat protein [Azospirillum sp. SYSU D00513]|uniref:tetratricopeptide repeat protein n=1 Tax=Azospirillum sp. SYSU D00513 TaxID=2812561 RepID=UPI001A972E47|nr:tetratricopeptide repeat protein [Azospirillum sp. SYSU D00513]
MTGRKPSLAAALALFLAGAAATASTPSPAAAIDHDRQFQACVTLAERAPSDALGSARSWMRQGGGDRARLCQALALFHKGEFKEAGTQLEELAPLLGGNDPAVEASLLARAGWAWLRAGDAAQADRLYSTALSKQPEDVDLLIDRAIARGETERYWDAVADLDKAIKRDPQRADAWLYRATAHKALANARQALSDVDRAIALRPGDPDALLLRGNLRAETGNADGARADWQDTIRSAPDSNAAKTARRNLDRVPAAGQGGKK